MSVKKKNGIICPHCQAEYHEPYDITGKKPVCKHCGKSFEVSGIEIESRPSIQAEPGKILPVNGAISIADLNRSYELIISEDRMRVELRAKMNPPAAISLFAIHYLLETKGVSNGIVKDSELESQLSTLKDQDSFVLVARGLPAVAGRNARLHYHFAKEQKVGTLGVLGKIDFKNKGETPFVHKEDLLVEKTPAVAGTPGYDVFGNELTCTPPSDVNLLFGDGVKPSEDNLKLYAKTDGQPKLSLGGRISVVSDLVIDGDVDLKTGHIEFEGDVKVTGTIQSGFNVKGANVEAREIVGAQVIASGDVKTTGGIIGAVVKAQGSIQAKFVKNATLSTFGDIVILKEITDSSVNTSGACRLENGKIISSEISAKQGIEAMNIGTGLSSPCKLSMGVDDHIEAEIKALRKAIKRRKHRLAENKEQMTSLDTEQQELHRTLTDLAQVQDRSLVKQRKIIQALEKLSKNDAEKRPEMEKAIESLGKQAHDAERLLQGLFDKQDKLTRQAEIVEHENEQIRDDICELENELEAIHHWSKAQKKTATLKVRGEVFQGTIVCGPRTRTVLKETVRHVTIQEVRNTDPNSDIEWETKFQHD